MHHKLEAHNWNRLTSRVVGAPDTEFWSQIGA